MSELAITGLGVHYGAFRALHDINLQIERGTFVTLLGPSGSGKTTLLRCIAGLVSPDAGRIVAGDRLFYDAGTAVGLPTRHRNLGMVFQAFALWPHMTIAENVAFPLRLRGWSRAARRGRVEELLELVGLPGLGERHPSQLSGGQQQRVGLARALSCEPSLLLMDEPLSSLDARLREEMRSHIRRLQKGLGITVIYVTHDREEALGLSDLVVILSGGRMVSTGTPRQLYREPPDSFTATFLAGWSLLGALDTLVAGTQAQWLAGVARPAACRCGGNCAALLPAEITDSLADSIGDEGAGVPCEIMNVEFLGQSVRIELRLAGIARPVFVTQTGTAGEAALRLVRGATVRLPVSAFRVLCQKHVVPTEPRAEPAGGNA